MKFFCVDNRFPSCETLYIASNIYRMLEQTSMKNFLSHQTNLYAEILTDFEKVDSTQKSLAIFCSMSSRVFCVDLAS